MCLWAHSDFFGFTLEQKSCGFSYWFRLKTLKKRVRPGSSWGKWCLAKPKVLVRRFFKIFNENQYHYDLECKLVLEAKPTRQGNNQTLSCGFLFFSAKFLLTTIHKKFLNHIWKRNYATATRAAICVADVFEMRTIHAFDDCFLVFATHYTSLLKLGVDQ